MAVVSVDPWGVASKRKAKRKRHIINWIYIKSSSAWGRRIGGGIFWKKKYFTSFKTLPVLKFEIWQTLDSWESISRNNPCILHSGSFERTARLPNSLDWLQRSVAKCARFTQARDFTKGLPPNWKGQRKRGNIPPPPHLPTHIQSIYLPCVW